MTIEKLTLIQQWQSFQKTPTEWSQLYFRIGKDGTVGIERNPSFFRRFVDRKQYLLSNCVEQVSAEVSKTEDDQFLAFCQQIVQRYKTPFFFHRIIRFLFGPRQIPEEICQFETLLTQRIAAVAQKLLPHPLPEGAESLKGTISEGGMPLPVSPIPEKQIDTATKAKIEQLRQQIDVLIPLVQQYSSEPDRWLRQLDKLKDTPPEQLAAVLREFARLEKAIYAELGGEVARKAVASIPHIAFGGKDTAWRVEEYLKKELPNILAAALHTKGTIKRSIGVWTRIGVVRCQYISESGKPPRVEIVTQAYLNEGNFKTIQTVAQFVGPTFDLIGQVAVYAKAQKGKKARAMLLNELRCMDLLRTETHGIPSLGPEGHVLLGHRVVKRKDPSKTKGILMPFCDKGTFKDLPPGVTPETLQSAIDGALGLHEIHQRGLVNMDVKPDNFFRKTGSDGTVRGYLGDHGLAALTSEKVRKKGTPVYMAPEVSSKDPTTLFSPDPSMDMWSYGISLVELFFGPKANAFRKASPKASVKQLRDATIRRIKRMVVGEKQKKIMELLDKLLSIDPSKRPDAKTVADTLSAMVRNRARITATI